MKILAHKYHGQSNLVMLCPLLNEKRVLNLKFLIGHRKVLVRLMIDPASWIQCIIPTACMVDQVQIVPPNCRL